MLLLLLYYYYIVITYIIILLLPHQGERLESSGDGQHGAGAAAATKLGVFWRKLGQLFPDPLESPGQCGQRRGLLRRDAAICGQRLDNAAVRSRLPNFGALFQRQLLIRGASC